MTYQPAFGGFYKHLETKPDVFPSIGETVLPESDDSKIIEMRSGEQLASMLAEEMSNYGEDRT